MVSLVTGCTTPFAVFFDFNNRACILIVDKFARDGDGRGISKSQVNDVIQCLA